MDHDVVMTTQKHPVSLRGGSEISLPPTDMVHLAPASWGITAGKRTAPITGDDRTPNLRREESDAPTLVQYYRIRTEDLGDQIGVAGEKSRVRGSLYSGVVGPGWPESINEPFEFDGDDDLGTHSPVHRTPPA